MISGIKWPVKSGEDATLSVLGVDTTDPTGWALLFTLVSFPGNTVAILTKTPTVSGPDLDGKFTLTVTLTRAETLALLDSTTDAYSRNYPWDIWRTDTDHNTPLSSGTMFVTEPSRLAV